MFAPIALDIVAVAGIIVWTMYLLKPELFKKKGRKIEKHKEEA